MSLRVLDHATIWPGDGRVFVGHVVVEGARIRSLAPGRFACDRHADVPRDAVLDLGGLALSPGLIDPFFCGGFGMDVVHDDLSAMAREQLRLGVTGFVIATGCLP